MFQMEIGTYGVLTILISEGGYGIYGDCYNASRGFIQLLCTRGHQMFCLRRK
jgi:hypothetical protein